MRDPNIYPPFASLRAFEAAARLGSFTEAAHALAITTGAISQHISLLESFAGKRLFIRRGRGVELTEAGARALPLASACLEQARMLSGLLRGGQPQQAKAGEGVVQRSASAQAEPPS